MKPLKDMSVVELREEMKCNVDILSGCAGTGMLAFNELARRLDRLQQQYNIAFRALEALSTTSAYTAERVGGVLAGCPRGPEPTPERLAATIRIIVKRLMVMAEDFK